ncbi:hypothetical protein B0O80DRAFT_281120 [Mortierella sp. GBAus27b]|nr:hypothetical protein B0O80DRAFT_281120 [Mortierella sp. GBAus27b]
MNQTTIVETFKCRFGELSFKELRRCFTSLKNVNISESGDLTSAMALEILVSCPQLEVLSFGPIMSRDVIDSPPWVCASSLKVLRASIQITPSQNSDVHQRHVLRRLSGLVNLEILDLIGSGNPNVRTLDLRLEKGLGQLATLQSLKRLGLDNYEQRMSVADVKWMVDNWRNLETVAGTLNRGNSDGFGQVLRQAKVEYRNSYPNYWRSESY